MSTTNVCIIGAGQLGSRHLQALQSVATPLRIYVVDQSPQSLATAEERFKAVTPASEHQATFHTSLDDLPGSLRVVIVATSSNVRRHVVERLLEVSQVTYLILEKYLFQRPEDFSAIGQLLERHGVQTWVNCSMRTMPFYRDLKPLFDKQPVSYGVSGGQYGLVTNAIHYLDYLSFLTGQTTFEISTTGLDRHIVPSKRQGFLELNGTLVVQAPDGSRGTFTCYPTGDAPVVMEISSPERRCISRESEQRAWMSEAAGAWAWQDVPAPIPFQSTMTTAVVSELLAQGTCTLTPYAESVQLHLQLLAPLLAFVNAHGQQTYDDAPFT